MYNKQDFSWSYTINWVSEIVSLSLLSLRADDDIYVSHYTHSIEQGLLRMGRQRVNYTGPHRTSGGGLPQGLVLGAGFKTYFYQQLSLFINLSLP